MTLNQTGQKQSDQKATWLCIQDKLVLSVTSLTKLNLIAICTLQQLQKSVIPPQINHSFYSTQRAI